MCLLHLPSFQIYNNVWTNICVDKPDIDVWSNWSAATCQWYWSSQSSQSQRLCKQVITVIFGVEQEDVMCLLSIIKSMNRKCGPDDKFEEHIHNMLCCFHFTSQKMQKCSSLL